MEPFKCVAVLLLLCGATFASVSIKPMSVKQLAAAQAKRVATPPQQIVSPNLDMCPYCVNFMDEFLNQVLNAILQAGVAGGCTGICSQLPNEEAQVACDVICLYVGVEVFVEIVEYEDPDPIFICQELDICNTVDNGAAKITKAYVAPPSGAQGATFNLIMQYKVINATGPGYLMVFVYPPDGEPFAGGEFTEGQAPGAYNIAWQLQAEPDENEDFSPGVYPVQFAVCEGDCSTSHKWGGIYDIANSSFTITN